LCNAPDIIAREVHEHDVLRALLRVSEELGGASFVLRSSEAARARPCDGTNLDHVAGQSDVHLRRAPNKRKIVAEVQTKHVRRRIDETKAAIEIERPAREIRFEALRQNHLENIAREDVYLGSVNHALKIFTTQVLA